jgi:hypothetical protein
MPGTQQKARRQAGLFADALRNWLWNSVTQQIELEILDTRLEMGSSPPEAEASGNKTADPRDSGARHDGKRLAGHFNRLSPYQAMLALLGQYPVRFLDRLAAAR